jgi:5-dehydro-4-deoxyglucarate dehydratase
MRIVGRSAGPVRPPLTDLTETEMGDLERLIDAAFGRLAG